MILLQVACYQSAFFFFFFKYNNIQQFHWEKYNLLKCTQNNICIVLYKTSLL